METSLILINIKAVLPELFQDPAHYIYVWLARVLGIDQNVIQVENDKNV